MKYEVEGIVTNAGGLFGYDVAAFRFDENHPFTIFLPHVDGGKYGDKVKLMITREESK